MARRKHHHDDDHWCCCCGGGKAALGWLFVIIAVVAIGSALNIIPDFPIWALVLLIFGIWLLIGFQYQPGRRRRR